MISACSLHRRLSMGMQSLRWACRLRSARGSEITKKESRRLEAGCHRALHAPHAMLSPYAELQRIRLYNQEVGRTSPLDSDRIYDDSDCIQRMENISWRDRGQQERRLRIGCPGTSAGESAA